MLNYISNHQKNSTPEKNLKNKKLNQQEFSLFKILPLKRVWNYIVLNTVQV